MIERRAIFLDRDGVINRKVPEDNPVPYVTTWSQFTFLPGARESVRLLHEYDFLILIITNQRCIARGMLTVSGLAEIHMKMSEEIVRWGGSVDGIYFCPHDVSDQCVCRKPKPGLIFQARDDLARRGIEIDWQQSIMVGDSRDDIEAGRLAGLKTLCTGLPVIDEADFMASDLFHATALILEHSR